MTPRPIGDQIDLESVLRDHQGANAALCSGALCALGRWGRTEQGRPSLVAEAPTGSFSVVLDPSRHAALPLPSSAARTVAEQYGLEPPHRAYGIEGMGNGNCVSAMAESEVHLCFYHETDLDRIRLTERVNFSEGGDQGNAGSTMKPFLGRSSLLLLAYGWVEGVLRWDEEQQRLLLTGEDRHDPACAIIQHGLILKEADPLAPADLWLSGDGPDIRTSFQVYRRCRLKGYVERVGDWVVLG